MKKIKIFLSLAVTILVIGSFVFVTNNSSASDCSLSLLDKNGNNTTQVTAGDRVSWRFNSSISGLKVYWFGAKNGKNDIWDINNGFYSNSTYSGVIYKTGEEGNYTRYVAFKNNLGNTICVTPKVNFSVVPVGSVISMATPTPVPGDNSINYFLKGLISNSSSTNPTYITASRDSASPSGYINAGAVGAEFFRINISASGQDVAVNQLSLDLNGNAVMWLSNIRAFSDGVVIGTLSNLTNLSSVFNTGVINLTGFTVPAGSTKTISFKADVSSSVWAGSSGPCSGCTDSWYANLTAVAVSATSGTYKTSGLPVAGNSVYIPYEALVVATPLTITTGSPLPNAKVGTNYEATVKATGGTVANYGWSLAGLLPSGLAGSVSVGVHDYKIIGTPATAGTYTFILTIASDGNSIAKTFTLTVDPANASPTITPSRQTVAARETATLNFTFPSNTVRATLYLACPNGVSTATSPDLCNTYILVTFNTNYSTLFYNTTGSSQNVVPNYYIYTSDNPNHAVGVSSEITVNPETSNEVCNNGKNYELTSDQRIYIAKIRMPTSYIIPSGSIKLGLRDVDTGEINYNLPYSYITNEPSKIGITGNIAKDLVSTYNDNTVFLNISSPELNSCANIKLPMRVMIGDPFLGKNTAFIYPKDIIPAKVLNPNQNWATISVGQLMSDFDVVKVTDVVRSIEEKMFGHEDFDGDPILMGLMPSACGSAGQPTGFGVGCLTNPNNEPQWGVIFHEMGHIGDNYNLVYWDGLNKNYSNNSYYFGVLNQNSNPTLLYSEGVATLAALYAEREVWQNNQKYNLSTKVVTGIKNQFYDSRSNYLKNLSDYESGGAVFLTATPDTLNGIFISIAENNSLNKFGWEVYPKFFKIYQNPLPTFVKQPLTALQYHTYFIAGLSAATGNDLRFLFRDKWHFPIDDAYFTEIYPKLSTFLGSPVIIYPTPTPTPVPTPTPTPGILILTDTNNEFSYPFASGRQVLGFNVAKKVNESSSQPVDFIILFPDFGTQTQALVLQSRIPGIGNPNIIDNPDPNTKEVVQMGNPKYLIDAATVDNETNLEQQRTVVVHELGHFYGAYMTNPNMNLTDPIDNVPAHYDSCMFWPGAKKLDILQDGNILWEKIDSNTFSPSTPIGKFYTYETKTYGPLTLYLMGLIPKEEVPQFHIIRPDVSKNAGCQKGTDEAHTIGEFINTYGVRVLAYPSTQKVFSARVVILKEPNSDLGQREIDFVKKISEKLPETFYNFTSGKGSLVLVSGSPVPTPKITLISNPRPTPTPLGTPVPVVTIDSGKIYTSNEISDGDIIRGQGDIAVWIIKTVGDKKFKRWLFGPQLFKIYGHLGFNRVKNVSKTTLSQYDTTNLIRKSGDEKVYELTDYVPGIQAIKRWVPSLDIFIKRGFDTDSIYTVNDGESNLYKEGASLAQ